MKIKRFLLVVIISILALLTSMNYYVYAADNFSVEVSADKRNYTEGQIVILTVRLSNINSDNGIYKLNGTFDYKTDVFEEIVFDEDGNTEQITLLNDWGDLEYNKEDNSFSIATATPARNLQNIMQIELKIKQDATIGKTFVMLNNLVGSNGVDNIETSPITISVNVQDSNDADDEQIPSIVTTPSPSPTTTPKTTPSNTVVSSPVQTTASPTDSDLPQTGISDNPTVMLFIGLIVCLATYIAYRRYKNF